VVKNTLGLKVISVEERFVEQHGIRRDWIMSTTPEA
jgi:hypothetical protein